MKTGDQVRVYPHGSPDKSATGIVAIISRNQRSIAVGFAEKPPFATIKNGTVIHPDFGIMLLATRGFLNGKPWGPWVEMVAGGHYEIEELDA